MHIKLHFVNFLYIVQSQYSGGRSRFLDDNKKIQNVSSGKCAVINYFGRDISNFAIKE